MCVTQTVVLFSANVLVSDTQSESKGFSS